MCVRETVEEVFSKLMYFVQEMVPSVMRFRRMSMKAACTFNSIVMSV